MAEEISVDTVCHFILSNGGKVKNTILVSHFKKSLNNPQTKDAARQKFKECVNTVAVVKTENNEKFVHLKKKYRSPTHSSSSSSSVPPQHPSDPSPSSNEPLPKHQDAPVMTDASPPTNQTSLNKSYDPVYDLPYADGATQPVPTQTSPKHHSKSPKHHKKDHERPSQAYGGQEDQHIYDQVPDKNETEPTRELPNYKEHMSTHSTNESVEKAVDNKEANVEEKSSAHNTDAIDGFSFGRKSYSPTKSEKKNSFKKQDNVKTEDMEIKKTDISMPTGRPQSISIPSRKSQDGEFAMPSAPLRKKKDKKERKENVPPSPSLDRHSGAIDRLKASLQNSGESGRLSRTRPTSTMQASYTGSVEKARLNFQNKHKGNEDAASLAISERSVDSKGEGDQDYDDERSGPIFALDRNEKSWMIRSCQCNMLEMRKLLNMDDTLAGKKDFISTALHWAAKKGDQELIKMLVELKVDINSRSHGGYTPLHLAAMQGHEAAISLLLEQNADPTIRDYSGRLPMQYLKAMSLPLQRLFGGKEITNTGTKDFAAGLRPRLDSVRKSNRLSSVISGGIGSVGKLLSKSNEDLNQLSDGNDHLPRKGSLRSKLKKKSRKKSKEEKPTISIVSYDDFDSGYHGAKSVASISSISGSSSSPNLRKPGTNYRFKDGRTWSRTETLDVL